MFLQRYLFSLPFTFLKSGFMDFSLFLTIDVVKTFQIFDFATFIKVNKFHVNITMCSRKENKIEINFVSASS